MNIETKINVDHLELIKIFLEANELNAIANEDEIIIRGVIHKALSIVVWDEDSEIKLTFMGVRHAGVLNMLDDYLLKCGVAVDTINPKTMHRQLQSEKEDRMNEEFVRNIRTLL